MGNHALDKWREKLIMYLDNALSVEEEIQLRYKVNNDPTVNKIFQSEHQFRTYIKKNFNRPQKLENEFISSLKQKCGLHHIGKK